MYITPATYLGLANSATRQSVTRATVASSNKEWVYLFEATSLITYVVWASGTEEGEVDMLYKLHYYHDPNTYGYNIGDIGYFEHDGTGAIFAFVVE